MRSDTVTPSRAAKEVPVLLDILGEEGVGLDTFLFQRNLEEPNEESDGLVSD
jgi:hypothetical protein